MARRPNVFVPLACPHCMAELLPTLDDIQDERAIRCSACGTEVDLHPDDVPMPGMYAPGAADDLTM